MTKEIKLKRNKGQSVQELIGIKAFTEYGLLTERGELLFFTIAPTNISVLSPANIESKTRHLMLVLSAMPELEIVCTDASECFDGNRQYLLARKAQEPNPKIRDLLSNDIQFLDRMQTEMATARQFVLIIRSNNQKPEQVFQAANRAKKVISDQGFETKRMKKEDIKRFLALYFDASLNGEQLPDTDGEQYAECIESGSFDSSVTYIRR